MKKNKADTKYKNNSNQIWVLYIGVIATTFYISTTSEDPFNTPKFIILLFTAGWLFGHLFAAYATSGQKLNSFDLKILIVVIFFILSQTLALIFSDLKFIALFGDTQRRNGYLTYVSFSIILLYAAKFLNLNNIFTLLKMGIFSGSVLAVYALLQTLGLDFFSWENPYNSIIVTLGNPNFASAFLAILGSFASLSYLQKDMGKLIRVIALPTVILCLFAIIRSQSRQGLVTFLFIHLIFFSMFYLIKNKKIGIIITCLSVSIVVISIAGMLQRGFFTSILYKESVSIRGFYWRAAWEMFKDNPFTGVGLDNYGGAFKAYRELDYPLRVGYSLTSSSAHNTVLQMFATGGLLVGVSYLLIIFFVFKRVVHLIKIVEPEYRVLVLLFTSVWVGFQAQSIISIDNIGLTTWGWLITGILLALTRELENKKISPDQKNNPPIITKSNSRILIQQVISLMVLLPILIVAIQMSRAERDTWITRTIVVDEKNRNIAKSYAQRVLNNRFAEPFYKYKASLTLFDFGFTSDGFATIEKLLRSDPTNLYFLGAKAYYQEINGDISGSVKTRETIQLNDPWNADNLLVLGLLHLKAGNLSMASEYKLKVLSIAANTDIGDRALKELP